MDSSMYDVVIPDTNGRKYTFGAHRPLLLRINIVGQIGTQGLTIDDIRSVLIESRQGPFKANPIKGILLNINTPGGAATDSESIYYAIKSYAQQYQIPVYAYVDGMCASGGMYAACAADKVYASESSIIGSVGVIWMFFNFSQGMEKVGVQNQTLTAGTSKGAMNPYQPWTPTSSEEYQRIVNFSYEQFVSTVSQARPKLTVDLLKNTYGAKAFYSTQAEEYGYIDGAGYQYPQAVELLAKAAEVENYQVVELLPKMHLRDLFNISNKMLGEKNKLDRFLKNPLFFMSPNTSQLMHLYLSSEN